MTLWFEDKISGRWFLATNAKNITDYLRHLEKDLNDRLTEMKVVSLNHFYDLVELPRVPFGNDVGWVFNPWVHVRISASSGNLNEGSIMPKFTLRFDPEPEPWETLANPYNVSIPRRNGKTLCAEAMKHIREEYLENRKENNMGPEKKTTGVLFAAVNEVRGLHTVELKIKNVIFNDPATIVFWSDSTKTVVKAGPNDTFDPEKGLAMAISKKVLGNNYKAYGRFKKWLPKEYRESNDDGLEGLAKAFDDFGKTVKEALGNATSKK